MTLHIRVKALIGQRGEVGIAKTGIFNNFEPKEKVFVRRKISKREHLPINTSRILNCKEESNFPWEFGIRLDFLEEEKKPTSKTVQKAEFSGAERPIRKS